MNIGAETEPLTFQFAGNQWYNEVSPTNSVPNLPTTEIAGVYGVDPAVDPDDPIAWDFDWGTWFVNATDQTNTVNLSSPGLFSLASPGPTGEYHPESVSPLHGEWTFAPLAGSQIVMPPFSQVVLAKCGQPGICNAADFSVDGLVNHDDLDLWQTGFGTSANATHTQGDADADHDIDGSDFLRWQRDFSAASTSLTIVPEPATATLLAALTLGLAALRRTFFR